MSDEATYNGWRNYETWLVNLEFCEDITEGWYEENRRLKDRAEIASTLKDEVHDIVFGWVDPQAKATDMVCVPQPVWAAIEMWARASMQRIDWDEIASHHSGLAKEEN